MQPQSHFVWRGLEVIGCARGASTTVDGVRFLFEAFDNAGAPLRLRPDFSPNMGEDDGVVAGPTL